MNSNTTRNEEIQSYLATEKPCGFTGDSLIGPSGRTRRIAEQDRRESLAYLALLTSRPGTELGCWTCARRSSILHTLGFRFEGTWFPLDNSNARYPGVTVRNVPLIAYSLAIG